MPPSSERLTCPSCGQEHTPVSLAPGERALCFRCETVLAQGPRFGPNTTLVYALTGLIMAGPALFLPFITAGKFGREQGGLLFTGVVGLWDHGMRLLSVWVLLCGVVAPLLLFGLLLAILAPAHLRWPHRSSLLLARGARAIAYWAIPEVHVLAVLVALIRLGSIVDVTIGAGFWFYSGMTVALLLAWRSFALSSRFFTLKPSVPTNTDKRLKPRQPSRRKEKLSMATAFSVAAAMMLVPANFLPVLTTQTSGITRTDTIFSGITELWQRDLGAIAAIVFLASIVIPILKLAGLGWLVFNAHRGAGREARKLTRFYAFLDVIGRWSMLDVFLVAFLTGLVQFGALSTVVPREGIVAFAISVVLTVLATNAFDPRLLWRDRSIPLAAAPIS